MGTIKTSELTRQIMKRAVSLQKKKYRNIESAILVEGLLPLEEAVKSNYVIFNNRTRKIQNYPSTIPTLII